ncbi:C4-dicarboxylate TRAP transporter substrate-binding protein [Okibacterium endophyticum]
MFTQHIPRRQTRAGLAAAGLACTVTLLLGACAGGTEEGGGGGDEETFEFTLATAATAETPNAAVQDWYLDRVEEASDGRITFDRTATEALCKAPEVVDCVRDGRAQIGVTVPDYTPQYFPTLSVVGIPFINQNSQAITAALYNVHTEYEPAQLLMEQNGLHYVSAWPVGRFILGTEEPVENVGDLAGLQARSSGPVIQQVLTEAGMNIAAITASETYEAVERGVINSVGGAIDFPVNYKLMELLPYWSDPGIGQYSTFGMWFSQDAYSSLPDDLKQVVDDVTEELNGGEGVRAFNDQAAGQCDQMLDAPTVEGFTGWSESATEEWEAEVGDSAEQKWVEVAGDAGLEDPESLLDFYKTALDENADAEYTDATLDCVEQFASR